MEVIGDHEGSRIIIGSGYHVFLTNPFWEVTRVIRDQGVLEGSWG